MPGDYVSDNITKQKYLVVKVALDYNEVTSYLIWGGGEVYLWLDEGQLSKWEDMKIGLKHEEDGKD